MYRTMFNAASRRASVYAPKSFHQLPLHRSLCNTSRPVIHCHRPNNNERILYSSLFSRRSPRQIQTRHLTFSQRMKLGFRKASKDLRRKDPIFLPFAILSVLGATAFVAYLVYIQVTVVAPQYHNYPQPVAKALRKGVYHTEIDLNPPKALKAYKEALKLAIELGMHPFSDEVLGIKIQVAMMLEKAGLAKPAIEVLERTKTESLKWIEESRMKKEITEKELQLEKKTAGSGSGSDAEPSDAITIDDPEILEVLKREQETAEFEERQRDSTLKKVIGMQMKIAELYSSDYIQDDKKGEAAQVAAVELSLKEMRRRQSLGLPVGVGESGDSSAWLNLTEIATALADLANLYIKKDKYEFALPLYLRALDILRSEEGDSRTCKQVVLLNGISGAMTGLAQNLRPTQQQQQQQQAVEAARQWAQKAIDVSDTIVPPLRDEECDVSCVAATYNLGELAEMLNQRDEAGKRYREAKGLAQSIDYDDGVVMAESALKRLSKRR